MKPKNPQKKIINPILITLILIICSVSVHAILAGEQEQIMTIDRCETLFVNVTGTEPIDSGEYELINCTEVSSNHWYCDCHNNYKLFMETQINTMNTYTVIATAYTKDTSTSDSSTTSSRSPGVTYYFPPQQDTSDDKLEDNQTASQEDMIDKETYEELESKYSTLQQEIKDLLEQQGKESSKHLQTIQELEDTIAQLQQESQLTPTDTSDKSSQEINWFTIILSIIIFLLVVGITAYLKHK